MPSNVNNNLYPPILNNTFNPAFIYNGNCKIYYKISQYNQPSQLSSNKPVQITVQDLKTNKTVLHDEKYPSGIKLAELVASQNNPGYYQIQLEKSDHVNRSGDEDNNGDVNFKLNTYYKVQLRFTAAGASEPPSSNETNGLDTWLSENAQYFSEWSTVTLIYGISQPTAALKQLQEQQSPVTLSNGMIPIVGKVSFQEANDTEKLKSYQIQLYDNNNTLIENSANIFPENTNEINYILKSNIQNDITYTIEINFTTQNLYTFTKTYRFICTSGSTSTLPCNIQIQTNDTSGYIQILLSSSVINTNVTNGHSNTLKIKLIEPSSLKQKNISQNDLTLNTSDSNYQFKPDSEFTIRRSSNKDHFTLWEDIYNFNITESSISQLKITDYTVQPGVWYKYLIVREYNNTLSSKETDPYMIYSQDIFLSANNEQIKVRFDPQVNNFSVKVSQSIVETIGSKYPFIKRNSNLYYRTFSLSGTITYHMDYQDNLFNASEEDFYSDILNQYEDFKLDNKALQYKNYLYEKDFRDKVIKFLYNDDVKLFRSLTQGNMLVKLSNVTLSPNNSLSRLVYSFSCTVYEIDKANVDNYKKYNNIYYQGDEI